MNKPHNPLAYVLWVIVGLGLAYGVTMTALKASDLFTEDAEPLPAVSETVEVSPSPTV